MTEQDALELDWLRWFYDNVQSAIGPASDDVIASLKEDYVLDGGVLPESYVLGDE